MQRRKKVHTIYSFTIGKGKDKKKLLYNDVPLEACYYHRNPREKEGVYFHYGNIVLCPQKVFATLEDAFKKMKESKVYADKNYRWGIVKDFSTGTMYFDTDDDMDPYWEKRKAEQATLRTHIKVENWDVVPKSQTEE